MLFVATARADGSSGRDTGYAWHTFFGESTTPDSGGGVVLDSAGNIYLAGHSVHSWAGPGGESPLHDVDWFVGRAAIVKLGPDGQYLWHTFYGEAASVAIALAPDGDVVISGDTGASWLGDGDQPPLHAFTGLTDLYVLKLSPSGGYRWHTFHGKVDAVANSGKGAALDNEGNIYVGVVAEAWTGYVPLHGHSDGGYAHDFCVLSLDPGGSYRWHTYYGPAGTYSQGGAVTVWGDAVYYTGGSSEGSWLGDGGAAPLHAFSGPNDMVVLKLDTDGAYHWHTFYGPRAVGRSIATDGQSVYITGDGREWLGDGGSAPLNQYGTIGVLSLTSTGAYRWHTFWGGTSTVYPDEGEALTVRGDRVYVGGMSTGGWLGEGGAQPLHAFGGALGNLTVFSLDTSGGYQWHTFYGDAVGARATDVVVDASPSAFVAGWGGAWTGDGGAAPLNPAAGGNDLFVLKLNEVGPSVIFADGFETGDTSRWSTVLP